MKKIILFVFLFLISFHAHAKLKVVTTLPDIAVIALEVGGDQVEVVSLAKPGQDPHFLDPRPSYSTFLNSADLLIVNGLELEVGWLGAVINQSRNPKIQKGKPGYLDVSTDVPILEIPTGPIDRSMGDVHPSGNPHYLLDPRHVILVAKSIQGKLSLLYPSQATFFNENEKRFEGEMTQKIKIWEVEAKNLKGIKIITHHKSFSYLAHWLGFVVINNIEPKPGIPPSPSHLKELINKIKSEKVKIILKEDYHDPKPARKISQETGIPFLDIPVLVSEIKRGAIQMHFDAVIKQMKGAL